ncbi:MAG: hypothetical protein ACI9U2_001890 [Bradymonadia bacterium]|jgi:hypothetical protein
MRQLFFYSFIASFTLGAMGCDDEVLGPDTRQILVEVDPRRTIAEPEFDDDGNLVPPAPPTVFGRILVIAGEDEKMVHAGGSTELAVILLDTNGDPVARERIDFEIFGDTADSTLSSRRTVTDDNGIATVDFIAGIALGDYVVQVKNPETRVLEFNVSVVDLPTGGVDIGFEYEGPVALSRMEVYVIDDPDYCDDPYYLTPPDGVIDSGIVEDLFERYEVSPLLAGQTVSVVVRGRLAANGVLAAGGCISDVRIPDGEMVRVSVAMFLLPLNPAGGYTLENTYDFTDAIPGTLGEVINGLVQFFGTRNQEREIAALLFDVIENLARNFGGGLAGLAVNLLRGWLEDELNDVINGWIDDDAPDWVRDFFTIGEDIVGIVAEMEVISRMRISKPRRDGSFDGSQNWIGMAFYWRLPCEGDPDPECGRYEFTMDEVASAAEGIQLVFGQFTGRIHSYNQGIIDQHTMDLQYGRLIMFVLNNIVLPFIADGATNLRDALLNMANCPGFANGVTGGRGHLRIAGINIVSRDTIEGWCTGGIGIVGDAAAAIIGRLRVDTRLTLQGEMVFIEESDDLVVDRIENGQWTGVIRTSDDVGPPFDGTFGGPMDGAPEMMGLEE